MIDVGLGTFVTYNPKSVSLDTSLVEVMRWMDDHRIRHLPVVNSEREVVGILSDLDVARAVLASGSRAAMMQALGADESCTVESIMVDRPITIDDHDSPRAALEVILEKRIHSVPVVDQGSLVGMITSTDYLRELSYGELPSCHSLVSAYINECHTVIDPDCSVEEAHSIMKRQGAEFLPVAQGSCPVGIVSLRDLRRAMDDLLVCDKSGKSKLLSLLHGQPPTILASNRLGDAASMMVENRVKALAVVSRRHHLVGILTEDDVLRAMLPDLE